MKTAIRASATLAFGLGCMCMFGCPVVVPDGSTDMTTPAACTSDTDCPDGIACLFPDGEDQTGYCDVDETQVSSGMPAMCDGDGDCPDGIACVFANETDQVGFCDVADTQAP